MIIRYNYKGLPCVDEVTSVTCKRLKNSGKVDLIFTTHSGFNFPVAHFHSEHATYPICEELYFLGICDLRFYEVDFERSEYEEDVEEEREEKE